MKNYTEEWTVIVNKNKYILNEGQANLLRSEMKAGNRGVIFFDSFAISIPFVEEFYLSRKIYDGLSALSASTLGESISKEEHEKVRKQMEDFRNLFIKTHFTRRMSLDEVNTRRNKLLDQIENL